VRARAIRPLAAVGGLSVLLAGGLSGLLYLVTLALDGPAAAGPSVALGAVAGLSVLFGSALLWAAAVEGPPTAILGRRAPIGFLLALPPVLATGWLLLAGGAGAVALPPVHLLAALLPALAIVGSVAWHQGGLPAREALAAMAYGGCIATALALLAEAVVGIFLVVAVAAALGTTDEGQRLLEALRRAAEGAGTGATVELPPDLLIHPLVIGAVFVLLGLIGPLTEELLKSLAGAARPPATRGRAWARGVAAGAGFGVTEAVALGSVGAELSPAGWPIGMLVRALATLMHATMTGLAGLGWHALLVERRPLAGVTRLGLAFAGHALWNVLVLVSVLAVVAADTNTFPALAPLAGIAPLGVVALLTTILLWFRSQSRRYRPPEATASEPEGVPPASDDGEPA
jgi:hypothetical protein